MEGEQQQIPTEIDLPLLQKLHPYLYMPFIMKNNISTRSIYASIVDIYKYSWGKSQLQKMRSQGAHANAGKLTRPAAQACPAPPISRMPTEAAPSCPLPWKKPTAPPPVLRSFAHANLLLVDGLLVHTANAR
jgi:hypothetical protein